MRGAFARALPGVASSRQHIYIGKAFGGDDAFQRRQPVVIIGLAGVGIAGSLRLLDFIAERRGPFGPGEQAAVVKLQRQRKGFGLPGRAEHRPFGIARDACHGLRRAVRGGIGAHAGSRYGSNASMEILSDGSAASPHNSRPSNRTV